MVNVYSVLVMLSVGLYLLSVEISAKEQYKQIDEIGAGNKSLTDEKRSSKCRCAFKNQRASQIKQFFFSSFTVLDCAIPKQRLHNIDWS